jgi:HSP20 family protein
MAMTIVRWDPFRELSTMQDRVNRVFGDYYRGVDDDVMRRGTLVPPVDIFDNGNHELAITAELPGMKKEDIEITVDSNTLTMRGEKKAPATISDDQCHRVERVYGTFSRSFSLPPTVDGTKVTADYKEGVLTITLPMREEAKPRQIPVQVQ